MKAGKGDGNVTEEAGIWLDGKHLNFHKHALMIRILFFAIVASVALAAGSQAQMLTISEIYGGGGNSGSTLKNDYISIYNRGTTAVNIMGYSVQYAPATGAFSTGSLTPLSTTAYMLAPGATFIIEEAAGTGGTEAFPVTPNATGSINLSATAGKVALSNQSTAAVTGTADASVLDFVGYGTTANAFEGTAPAPAPSNTTSDQRLNGGATDTNQNSTDFTVGTPTLVPEPGTWAFVGVGLGLLILLGKRRSCLV